MPSSSSVPGSQRLSPDERSAVDVDGYVIREAIFGADEVAAITEACEVLIGRVVAGRRSQRQHVGSYTFESDHEIDATVKWEGDSDVMHGLEPVAHLSVPLAMLALDPRLVEPMVAFVGDETPMLFTEKLNLKRPRVGGVNPLHQDKPYWSFTPDADRIATAMLFLDDSDLGNGTLEVVPGSHRDGLWASRTNTDSFGSLEIDPALSEGLQTVAVEVPAGSVVYFGSTLVHRSAPNSSDRERRSLLYSYQPLGWPHMREALLARDGRRG